MLRVLKVLTVLVLTVLMVLMALVVPCAAQQAGIISGQVVDGVTGRPVSAAIVSVSGSGTVARGNAPDAAPRILTGADGRFTFKDVPSGSFTVVATKGGYAEGASGRRRPGGSTQAVMLTAAETTVAITVRVWKYAVLTGTVTDEAGEPVVNIQVRVAQRRAGGGYPFTPVSGPPVYTDDRGVYRFSGLLPGDYLVMTSQPGLSAPAAVVAEVARTGRAASELVGLVAGTALQAVHVGSALYGFGRGGVTPPPPVGTRMQVYPPTFHPSALSPAQASIVTLAAGEERSAVDLQLAPVTTSRVSGTLIGAAGPVGTMALRLLPAGGGLIAPEALGALAVTDDTGAFVFPAVVPGSYTLQESGQGAGTAWVTMPITVAGDDIDGLTAQLHPPLTITARAQFESSAAVAGETPRTPIFNIEREDGLLASAVSVVDSAKAVRSGPLTLTGYRPGRYRVRVTGSPTGWMFKAAMLDGVDVSQTAFELARDVPDLVLVFTDRWSGVSGVVQGTGADGAVVILFPTAAQAWINPGPSPRRLRSTRANAKGQFGISSVPPGEYYVAAIPDEQAVDWRDPAVLESLAPIATELTIGEGEHRTIDLRWRGVPR